MAKNPSLISDLQRQATLRRAVLTLLLFLVNGALLALMDRPLVRAAGARPLDLQFGYSLETVRTLFEAYGADGRQFYLLYLTVGAPFPLLGALATMFFLALRIRHRVLLTALVIPPALFAVTDWLENALFSALVVSYPDLSRGLVAAASVVTQVKWVAFYASMVLLAVAGAAALVATLLRRRAEG
jgi:hypothetical protein